MSRFFNLFRKKRLDRQMDEEFEFHLDQLAAQLMNSGITRHQALREARRQFGSLQSVREVYRDQQGVPWLADLFADLRHGLRLMKRNRGFSTIAVLTMAIGIGATASIFSFVNAVYLRPAPYPNAARLVDVVNEVRGYWNGPSHTSRRYLYFKERTQLFEEVAGWKGGGASTMVVQGEAEQVDMRRVSSNYFRTFGIAPRAGRFFLPEEDAVGAAKVVVLGFGLWQRRFGSSPDVLNQSIEVGGEALTIVGVAPPDPTVRAGLFVPLQARPLADGMNTVVAGLLRPGVTLEQSSSELHHLMQAYKRDFPAGPNREFHPDATVRAAPFGSTVRQSATPVWILSAAVGLMLLVACGNIANLLLSRATARVREIAIRISMGAGRGRLVRQLLAESLLISLLGSALGLALAYASLPLLIRLNPLPIATLTPVSIDSVVVGFATLLAFLTALLFGLYPALAATRQDANAALKETATGSTARRSTGWLRWALVAGEVAISLVLLIGAGLFVRTLVNLIRTEPGVDPTNVLVGKMPLKGKSYDTTAKTAALFRRGLERLLENPMVESAAIANNLPMEPGLNLVAWLPTTEKAEEPKLTDWRFVSASYFETLRIPLLNGRSFAETDGAATAGVAIISREFARRYFKDQDPIGQPIHIRRDTPDPDRPRVIIGVVGDVKSENFRVAGQPTVYVPLAQAPDGLLKLAVSYFPAGWVVRTKASIPGHDLEAQLKAIDPMQPFSGFQPLASLRDSALAKDQSMMFFLSGFAFIALLLAAAGIYGVMSYTVAQRTSEIGIRMALGATGASMVAMVVRQGLLVTLVGVALGVAGALAFSKLLAALVFDVKPTDPATFVVASALLSLTAAVASLIPALRITRMDLVRAIRSE